MKPLLQQKYFLGDKFDIGENSYGVTSAEYARKFSTNEIAILYRLMGSDGVVLYKYQDELEGLLMLEHSVN